MNWSMMLRIESSTTAFLTVYTICDSNIYKQHSYVSMKAGSLILQWCRVPLQYNECKHKNGKHHTGLEGDVNWVVVTKVITCV